MIGDTLQETSVLSVLAETNTGRKDQQTVLNGEEKDGCSYQAFSVMIYERVEMIFRTGHSAYFFAKR